VHLFGEREPHSEPLATTWFGVDADELATCIDDEPDALSCLKARSNQACRVLKGAFFGGLAGGAARKFERSVQEHPDISVELLLGLDDEQLAPASGGLPSNPPEGIARTMFPELSEFRDFSRKHRAPRLGLAAIALERARTEHVTLGRRENHKGIREEQRDDEQSRRA